MSLDRGRAADRMGVGVLTGARDTGGHKTLFRVEKWDTDQIAWTSGRLGLPPQREPGARHFALMRVRPFEIYEAENCNLILDAGWQMLMNGIAGSSVTKFSTTGPVGRIGGGISATAAAYTQTDLQAATGAANRQWELLSANPTVGSTHSAGLIFAATFPTTDGNFAWAEFGVDSGTTAGTGASVATMLNRGTASPGTKTSAQTWNVTVTITWT
jgi:hypothetical protein